MGTTVHYLGEWPWSTGQALKQFTRVGLPLELSKIILILVCHPPICPLFWPYLSPFHLVILLMADHIACLLVF